METQREQELAEKQAGRARADDRDLYAHHSALASQAHAGPSWCSSGMSASVSVKGPEMKGPARSGALVPE